eukprot:Hpha_TRINITY_DN1581_c0_g1::TRINITY_DN1581_c0_g1_i1::g.57251::m.57251
MGDDRVSGDFGRTWRLAKNAERASPTLGQKFGDRLSDSISKYKLPHLSQVDLSKDPFESTTKTCPDEMHLPDADTPFDSRRQTVATEATPLRGRAMSPRGDSEPNAKCGACCLVM